MANKLEGIITLSIFKKELISRRFGIFERCGPILEKEMIERGASTVKGMKCVDHKDRVELVFYVDEKITPKPNQPYMFPDKEMAMA